MTTKVTVSVPAGANWRAKIEVLDGGAVTETVTLDPHSEREFYVTSTRDVHVSEEPLEAKKDEADGQH